MLLLQRKLRPATKMHGGKRYLHRKIVPLFPEHKVYVEPYAGGLNVLLNKPRSEREFAGDLNSGLMHFYRVLRDRSDELLDRIKPIAYTRENFLWACQSGGSDDPIERAVRFLVRNRLSRGGLGKHFAWSERLRGGRPGDLNAWETFKDMAPTIVARLRGVEFHHGEAIDLMQRLDSPDTLFYCDPPYIHDTRTARKAYQHEMSDLNHERLLGVLTQIRGMVVLSGYRSDLYDSALEGWERHEFDMANHSGQTRSKSRRVEVIWMNPASTRFCLCG